MRRYEVSRAHNTTTLRGVTKLKGKKTTEQALVSAPERDKRYTGSEQILHSV